MGRVLVVDDEQGICQAFREVLEERGHKVEVAATAERGLERADDFRPEVVILDVCLPGMDGLSALRQFRARQPAPSVIVITAQETYKTAVAAMREGAFEFLPKPIDLDVATVHIERAFAQASLNEEVARLRALLARQGEGTAMVGRSLPMQEIYKQIGTLAATDVAVLVQGESGTGKELVAREIHAASRRSAGPFEPVNCAALPETLLQSELFGHEKGAFTGAASRHAGRFEAAHGGTLFLDEIGEMPLPTQGVFLRVLEEKTIQRLGDASRVAVDVRVVAATHADLAARVRDGTFREDLYYRLRVAEVRVPPLRERLDDLPLLVTSFLSQQGHPGGITDEAMVVLRRHPWPGNVRELRNAIAHASAMSRGIALTPSHLPDAVRAGLDPASTDAALERLVRAAISSAPQGTPLHEAVLARFEKPLLRLVMEEEGGNQVRAAARLGIHRTTLRGKLAQHGLTGKEE
ncbi:MAG: sigma-54-dependent Fis family transcriptional regulator [Planctomycetes bacterium]|nr:sigma-54-dependent Fis family transcriptional regulator [Planctomycetota bacterium]